MKAPDVVVLLEMGRAAGREDGANVARPGPRSHAENEQSPFLGQPVIANVGCCGCKGTGEGR